MKNILFIALAMLVCTQNSYGVYGGWKYQETTISDPLYQRRKNDGKKPNPIFMQKNVDQTRLSKLKQACVDCCTDHCWKILTMPIDLQFWIISSLLDTFQSESSGK